MAQKEIAFFDLDGTITRKDTMLEVIKFIKGDFSFYFGFVVLAPMLILYKLKIISNWRAKELMLTYFFGGMDTNHFNQQCDEFCMTMLPRMIRAKALDQINEHKNKGDEVWIVSSSAQNWIRQWCKDQKLRCLASRLEEKNGKITGKLDGKNCYGKEKVNFVRQAVDLKNYDVIWAYGDSKGDKELLAIADYPHYKPFRKKK